MCDTLDGLPLTTCVPSPQLIVHCVIVSVPGSDDDKLSVYDDPSFTSAAPLIASVGATLWTATLTVFPAADVPSSSVAVALIVRLASPSA